MTKSSASAHSPRIIYVSRRVHKEEEKLLADADRRRSNEEVNTTTMYGFRKISAREKFFSNFLTSMK